MTHPTRDPNGQAHSAPTQTAAISCRTPLISRARFPRASILHVKAIGLPIDSQIKADVTAKTQRRQEEFGNCSLFRVIVQQMNPEPTDELDRLAHEVIGAAIEVHRILGPGFLESVCEDALCIELQLRNIPFQRQVPIPVVYKNVPIAQARLDLLVSGKLIVELKTVDALAPIHKAQTISYLKATGLTLALLINFNTPVLKDGIKRIIRS